VSRTAIDEFDWAASRVDEVRVFPVRSLFTGFTPALTSEAEVHANTGLLTAFTVIDASPLQHNVHQSGLIHVKNLQILWKEHML